MHFWVVGILVVGGRGRKMGRQGMGNMASQMETGTGTQETPHSLLLSSDPSS